MNQIIPPPDRRRPVVMIPLLRDVFVRDLVQTGFLAALTESYELRFFVSRYVTDRSFEPFASAMRPLTLPGKWSDLAYDKVRRLNNLTKWEGYTGIISTDILADLRRKQPDKILARVLNYRKLGLPQLIYPLGKAFLRYIWRKSDYDMGADVDLILLPLSMRDFHIDGLTYWARKNAIPTLGLQMGLDNFSLKCFLEQPDYVAAWGDLSWYVLRLLEHYPTNKVRIVGAPRFEIYRDTPPSKQDARKRLNLDPDKKLILFCGGANMPNDQYLGLVRDAAASGALPPNIQILYKPHPAAMKPGSAGYVDLKEFACDVIRIVGNDHPSSWPKLADYPVLLAAADALISPYSTMSLEGAICGLPVLSLLDLEGADNNWQAQYFIHMHIYFDRVWSRESSSTDTFLDSLHELVALVGRPEVAALARSTARQIAYWDEKSFSDRMIEFIGDIPHKTLSTEAQLTPIR